MKIWVSDWREDVALRLCSPAARLLWVEILFYMHTARPYGHLVVSGKAATTKQIAALSDLSASQIPKLLHQLEAANVFSYNENRIIFSRRMVRDKDASDRGREIGKSGGNPGLRADAGKPAQQPPPLTPGVNAQGYGEGLTREAEAEEEEESEAAQNARAALAAAFSQDAERGASTAKPAQSNLPKELASLVTGWGTDTRGSRRPLFGNCYLDSLAYDVEKAAGFKPTWSRDWGTLAAWLTEGMPPAQILACLRHRAAWPSYRPFTSLEPYGKHIRKFKVKP